MKRERVIDHSAFVARVGRSPNGTRDEAISKPPLEGETEQALRATIRTNDAPRPARPWQPIKFFV